MTPFNPARTLMISAISSAILLGGCANMDETQRGTAQGAGIGAVAGAIIGQVAGKNAATGAVIGGIAGAVAGNVWSKRMQAQREAMEQATRGTDVEVTRTQDNQLKVNIPNDISFATGSAAIKPELRSVLETFASGLSKDSNGMHVRVVGHTDSTGSDSVNNPLSKERADSVKDFLTDRGVPASRVETAGRGEREPIASNDTAEGRAKNRRVEIFLREPEQASAQQPATR
ncbi:MAG TPA: OmpA family protein [Aquabacterium sp.]|uniref:OmpA family protein n=1 Tax=Aquabacterium sp. TaxID=1872578 RepID=UPI002E316DB0|nr:OmpA family protein [Aquabacterium sp.]HEX5355935.1 OmpA family protein [Aquabacterium sp.]